MRNPVRFSSRKTSLSAVALALAFFASACSYHPKEDSNSGDLQVQVPVSSQGQYSMSVMDLSSVFDLTHLRGAAAKLLIEPHIFKNQLRGRSPEIHYIKNSHGVIVATDADSLEMLTLYAQFEKLHALDQSLGVDQYNKWPVTVAVNALTKDASGGIEEDNAFYAGQFDAYLFAPYKKAELPLMVNSGVIGHEHFHSIFQHMVIDPLAAKYPGACQPTAHNEKARLKAFGLATGIAGDDTGGGAGSDCENGGDNASYNASVLRGLNEGLADVWGWIYSGDENFVQRSLPMVMTTRSLSYASTGLMSKTQYMNELTWAQGQSEPNRSSALGALPYEMGTGIARTVKSLIQKHNPDLSSVELRRKAAELVVAALPAIRDQINSLSSDQALAPADLMMTIASHLSGLTTDDCQWLENLIPLSDQSKNACGGSSTATNEAAP
jgi:hypothetical protein